MTVIGLRCQSRAITRLKFKAFIQETMQARVVALSAYDVASLPTYSALTALSGKTGLPPALANLAATGILFGYRLDWDFPRVGAL